MQPTVEMQNVTLSYAVYEWYYLVTEGMFFKMYTYGCTCVFSIVSVLTCHLFSDRGGYEELNPVASGQPDPLYREAEFFRRWLRVSLSVESK